MTPTQTGRIGRREIASTGIIWLERLWSATWPTSGVVAVFVAIALLDILPQLPAWLHIIVLLGFVGALGFLLLYAFLLFWIVNVALVARDRAGAVICIGAAAMLFWHMLVNIAMVLGMAPVVGVTLPLVSYGGSSLIVVFVALGLVSSVSMRRHGF